MKLNPTQVEQLLELARIVARGKVWHIRRERPLYERRLSQAALVDLARVVLTDLEIDWALQRPTEDEIETMQERVRPRYVSLAARRAKIEPLDGVFNG